MSTSHDDQRPRRLTGRHVYDREGSDLGTVTDVIYDDVRRVDTSTEPGPAWMVVDPGVLRTARYVPVAGTHSGAGGELVIPWDKERVRSAPKAKRSHVLTDADRRALTAHYEPAS